MSENGNAEKLPPLTNRQAYLLETFRLANSRYYAARDAVKEKGKRRAVRLADLSQSGLTYEQLVDLTGLTKGRVAQLVREGLVLTGRKRRNR